MIQSSLFSGTLQIYKSVIANIWKTITLRPIFPSIYICYWSSGCLFSSHRIRQVVYYTGNKSSRFQLTCIRILLSISLYFIALYHVMQKRKISRNKRIRATKFCIFKMLTYTQQVKDLGLLCRFYHSPSQQTHVTVFVFQI